MPGDDVFDHALAARPDLSAPLLTPQDAVDRVRALVQTAFVARWWFLLLDDQGHQLPVLPQVEMPPELGEHHAERLAETLVRLLEQGGPQRIVLVWELPDAAEPFEGTGPSLVAASVRRLRGTPPVQVLVGRRRRVELWTP